VRHPWIALALLGAAAPAGAVSLEERLPVCLACHGESGRSETAEVPSLGAQPASFVLIQLYQFREKQRLADPMNEMAQDLTDDDLRTFSDAVAKLPAPQPASDAPDATRIARGQALAAKYRCGSCHDPEFTGHDQMARLAGQREDYLAKTLAGYKSGERKGYDPQMNEVAQDIAEGDIPDLAYFLANFR
jgi:cytochrome c553